MENEPESAQKSVDLLSPEKQNPGSATCLTRIKEQSGCWQHTATTSQETPLLESESEEKKRVMMKCEQRRTAIKLNDPACYRQATSVNSCAIIDLIVSIIASSLLLAAAGITMTC